METDPSCEEHKDNSGQPTNPEVRGTISESADKDGNTELLCEPAEEGKGHCLKEPAETEISVRERNSSEMKSLSDPEGESEDPECKRQRNLRKTNSWKMVRFQDPSMEDDVVDRDSSAESLFPEYEVEEWTSSTFEKLFTAKDWQYITGEDRGHVAFPSLTNKPKL